MAAPKLTSRMWRNARTSSLMLDAALPCSAGRPVRASCLDRADMSGPRTSFHHAWHRLVIISFFLLFSLSLRTTQKKKVFLVFGDGTDANGFIPRETDGLEWESTSVIMVEPGPTHMGPGWFVCGPAHMHLIPTPTQRTTSYVLFAGRAEFKCKITWNRV